MGWTPQKSGTLTVTSYQNYVSDNFLRDTVFAIKKKFGAGWDWDVCFLNLDSNHLFLDKQGFVDIKLCFWAKTVFFFWLWCQLILFIAPTSLNTTKTSSWTPHPWQQLNILRTYPQTPSLFRFINGPNLQIFCSITVFTEKKWPFLEWTNDSFFNWRRKGVRPHKKVEKEMVST